MQAIVRDKGGGVEFQSPSQPPVVQQPQQQQQQQQQQQKPKQKPKITPPQATSSSNAARSRASLPKSKPAPAPAPAPTPKPVPAPVISTPAPAPIRKKTANSIFGLNLDDSPPVKSIASARSSTSTIGSEQSERSVPPKSAKKKAASLPPSQKQRTRQSVAGAGAGTNKGRRMSVEDMQGIVMDKATVR